MNRTRFSVICLAALISVAAAFYALSVALSDRPLDALRQSSTDDKEKQLLLDIGTARQLNGENSRAAFERLLDLALYYLEHNQDSRLIRIKKELCEKYWKLEQGDQQRLLWRLLEGVEKSCRSQKSDLAEVFYDPVVQNRTLSQWQNKDDLTSALNSFASRLLDAKRPLLSQKIYKMANSLQPDNQLVLRNLAANDRDIGKFNDAKSEFGQLITHPDADGYFHDLQSLALMCQKTGDTTKLKSLVAILVGECAKPHNSTELDQIARTIAVFIDAKLYGDAVTLYQAMIRGLPEKELEHVGVQTLEMAYGEGQTDKSAVMYKFWADEIKKRCGTDSEIWAAAMIGRTSISVRRNSKIDVDEIIKQIGDAKPKGGVVSQRLKLLCVYRMVLATQSNQKFFVVDDIFKSVPTDPLSFQLYGEGAEYYSICGDKAAAANCKKRAIVCIEDTLKLDKRWLRPYFEKLNEKTESSPTEFTYFAKNVVDALSRAEAYPSSEDLIVDELNKEGHPDAALQLTAELKRRP
jgi:hypothetical protein